MAMHGTHNLCRYAQVASCLKGEFLHIWRSCRQHRCIGFSGAKLWRSYGEVRPSGRSTQSRDHVDEVSTWWTVLRHSHSFTRHEHCGPHTCFQDLRAIDQQQNTLDIFQHSQRRSGTLRLPSQETSQAFPYFAHQEALLDSHNAPKTRCHLKATVLTAQNGAKAELTAEIRYCSGRAYK